MSKMRTTQPPETSPPPQVNAIQSPQLVGRGPEQVRESEKENSSGIKFVKYQALGNDYLVLNPTDVPAGLTPSQIRSICDRHYGVGSDGILLGL
jgi:hypothetical protein